VSEQSALGLDERLEQILSAHHDRQAMASACRLVADRALDPLFEAWKRNYPKVPPDLSAHLKAQSEFSAIMALHTALTKMAAETPVLREGETPLDRVLREAEEQMGQMEESSLDGE